MDIDLNKQLEDADQVEESELDEEEIRQKGDWHQQLLKACQKGDYDHAKRCLDKKANPCVEDKKKWNPLLWVSCKGYINLVRLLLVRGGASPYILGGIDLSASPTSKLDSHTQGFMQASQMQTTFQQTGSLQQKKVVTGVINSNIKQTPLQWACFKGHLQIVWLLLKAGLQWEDIDPFGNNCVHLAASGGSLQVFQTLLMFGVSVNNQNSRGHTVKDLATNREIISLIKQLDAIEKVDPLKKYWCMTSKDFHRVENYRLEWMFETEKSTEKEKPEGRCLQCWENIQTHTDELLNIVQRQDNKVLTEKLNLIDSQHIEIDLMVLQEARIQQEKLRTQNLILNFVNDLKYVENYKTIMKSVNFVREMLEDAEKRNVVIDQAVLEATNAEVNRLISERNLRFELDNLLVSQSVPEQVVNLSERMIDANTKGVAGDYLTNAEVLKEKMGRNIQAKKILKMFCEYPLREYPEPIMLDPKTKKPIDPITRKPLDPAKLALLMQKKKKKKEPKFIIPEWANDMKQLEENVKGIEVLLKDKVNLQLDQDFLQKSQEQIQRMKKEIHYRKQLDEELKQIADAKNAKKKKN